MGSLWLHCCTAEADQSATPHSPHLGLEVQVGCVVHSKPVLQPTAQAPQLLCMRKGDKGFQQVWPPPRVWTLDAVDMGSSMCGVVLVWLCMH